MSLTFNVILAFLAINLSSCANAGNHPNQLIQPQSDYKLDFVTSTRFSDTVKQDADPSALNLIGQVHVVDVGGRGEVLRITLDSVSLKVADGKTKAIEATQVPRHPLYLDTKTNQIYSHQWTESSLGNLMKGIASLFQHSNGQHANHLGKCKWEERKLAHGLRRVKSKCSADAGIHHGHGGHPLGLTTSILRETLYQFEDTGLLQEIVHLDHIESKLIGNQDNGLRIEAEISLMVNSILPVTVEKQSLRAMIQTNQLEVVPWDLYAVPKCQDNSCVKLSDYVEFQKDALAKTNLGNEKLALATIYTILDMQTPTAGDVEQMLASKKAKSIRGQLLDVLGALQTWEPYHMILTKLMGSKDAADIDDLERYLQTLSVGWKPEIKIVEDLLQRLTVDTFENVKLKSTFIQTLASMVHIYGKVAKDLPNVDIVAKVEAFLWDQFQACTDVPCKEMFLRGFVNLRPVRKVHELLEVVQKEGKLIGQVAMKALTRFKPKVFHDVVVQRLLKSILYQRTRKFDSSIRTMAIDILLKGKLTEADVQEILRVLHLNDKAYEVKQYLLEKLKILSEKCDHFKRMLQHCMRQDAHLNNYHRLGTGGLSTALRREFLRHPSLNSSLVSVQEIEKGVLKRGIVDMFFTKPKDKAVSFFTLELFARGMSSFVSSSSADEEEGADAGAEQEAETLTAGMEVNVNGQLLRPLVFFEGQGELMGHVWSGTASDPVSAYQATTVAYQQRFAVLLQSGIAVEVDIITAISIDLKGQVTLSLWNRNGQSNVEQNIGVATVGRATALTDYSQALAEFQLLQSPKLSLQSNFEFSGNNLLCLQLTQPDLMLKKSFRRKTVIPELKVNQDDTKTEAIKLPGNSHLLNAKNNEMCRTIYRNEL